MRIIPRRIEVERLRSSLPWAMMYGRRKTGKTFIARRFLSFDKYFFVARDGVVLDLDTGEHYTYAEFVRLVRELLGSKSIVVDEFHRLPPLFLDVLHADGVRGELVLITSTLWLSQRLLGSGSPLLGLVRPVKVGLVDEREIIAHLSREFRGRGLVEASTYLREVMLSPFFGGRDVVGFLAGYLYGNGPMLRELIGEVFREEERRLTEVYEGILRGVADGRHTSTELSTFLYSRGLIVKDNPGVTQKYLDLLTRMGLLERLRVYGRRKYRYYHLSPLLDLHFYLEAKYMYTEVETPRGYIEEVVEKKMPLHVEQYVRSLLAKIFGLQPVIIEKQGYEVDVALLRFNRLSVVAEVKWRLNVPSKSLRLAVERLERFKGARKILVVPEAARMSGLPGDVEVWGVDDLLAAARDSLEEELGG